MVKIFFCLVFIGALASCSPPPMDSNDSPRPGFVDLNVNLTYNNQGIVWQQEGFQPVENYPYGFDYIQNNNIAHISLLDNSFEDVDVYVNTMYDTNFDYYICSPDNVDNFLAEISSEEAKSTYSISSSFGEIALCKEEIGGMYKGKIQDLYVHSYEKKNYDFQLFILGNPNSITPESQLLNGNEFWNAFNKYYRQALIEHGSLSKKKINSAGTRVIKKSIDDEEPIGTQRNYVLTRVKEASGNESSKCSNKGDIGNTIKSIEDNVYPRRAIIQIGYPTKRFWPLKEGVYNSEICGTYSANDNPENESISLELEPLPSADPYSNCLDKVAEADVIWKDGIWQLEMKDGSGTYPATEYNADPNCVVFAEKELKPLGTYIGEIDEFPTLAETKFEEQNTIVILPWLGDRLKTTRTALHELGHTMGLLDINDNGSYANNSEQSNLMHYNDSKTGYKLRKRSMTVYPTSIKQENQWDCLQKIDKNQNCADTDKDIWNIED